MMLLLLEVLLSDGGPPDVELVDVEVALVEVVVVRVGVRLDYSG